MTNIHPFLLKNISPLFVIVVILFSKPVSAVDFALDVHGGLLGAGIGATIGLTDNLNTRLGFNALDIDGDFDDDGLEYNATLELDNQYIYLDWHPFKRSSFRITAGLVSNDNVVSAMAISTRQVEIGVETVDVGATITASVGFDSTAPYIGIGWGNNVGRDKRIGFHLDIGLLQQGDIDVQVAGNLGSTDLIDMVGQRNIDLEAQNIIDAVDDLEVLPIISIGMSYRFF